MPSATVSAERRGSWLVFADSGELAVLAIEELAARGEDVTIVRKGEGFRRLGDRSYAIDPARAGDYLRLLQEIPEQPRCVLYLWGLAGAREAFDSLLLLGQAFGDHPSPDLVECLIVSAEMYSLDGRESVDPEQALLSGPCKVMPLEYPFLHCRSLDIGRSELSRSLVAELLSETWPAPVF